jgi:glycosyltransferase involved in cell wall biosynthesis
MTHETCSWTEHDLLPAENLGRDQPALDRVSVIVPCRNEFRYIRGFLDGLLHQDLGSIEMEVLVVDGMSIDGTRNVLREFAGRCGMIRIIDNPDKIAAAGLNKAIRESRGEIILRMDVHTEYAPDYVRSCLEVLQETNADNVGGAARTRAGGYLAQAIACGFHSSFATGGAKFRDPQHEGEVTSVPYGCWRKATLEFVGLFDEELVRGQDDELNCRIISCGGRVWQSRKIVSWYRPRTTLTALFRQFFQNGFWKVAVIRKLGRPPSLRNLVPGAALFLGILLPLAAAGASLNGWIGWRNALLAAWMALAAAYALLSLAESISVAKRNGWTLFPILPLVFATYQLAYALGFLAGVFARPATSGRANSARKVLTPSTK